MWSLLPSPLSTTRNEGERNDAFGKDTCGTLALADSVRVHARGGGLQTLVVVYFAAARRRFEGCARSAINVVKVVYGHVADLRENGDRRG